VPDSRHGQDDGNARILNSIGVTTERIERRRERNAFILALLKSYDGGERDSLRQHRATGIEIPRPIARRSVENS